MAKTNHRIYKEELERTPEPQAHRSRREFRQLLHAIDNDEAYFDDDEDALERHERIKRPRKGR